MKPENIWISSSAAKKNSSAVQDTSIAVTSSSNPESSSPSKESFSSPTLLGYNPVLLKHLTIVSFETSSYASFPHSIDINKSKDFTLSLALFDPPTLLQTWRNNLFL